MTNNTTPEPSSAAPLSAEAKQAAEKALQELAELEPFLHGDHEVIHSAQDKILLRFIRAIAPEVADKAEGQRERGTFWFA